jgi:hypothetical protein
MKFQIFGLALLATMLSGCSSGERYAADSAETAKAMSQASEASAEGGMAADSASLTAAPSSPPGRSGFKPAAMVKQRAVVRQAELRVRVKDVEKAERTVGSIAAEVGGYLDSANSTDLASDHPKITMTLRVPVEAFDPSMQRFEGLGTRLSKTVSSEDVTGQLVDYEAQLKTLAAQEETYRGLLKQSRSLDSVITLQDKLTEVRTNIERIAAMRKALAGQAAMSTIQLTLEQDAVLSAPPADPDWLSQSWAQATTGLVSIARAFAVMFIWLAVFSPLWVPILLLARRAIAAANAANAAKPPVVNPNTY